MFVFKNQFSTEYNVYELNDFPIPVSTPRLTQLTIPGRHGKLTIEDGGYDGSEISATVVIKDELMEGRLDEIATWLSGSGKLEISGRRDRYYKARVSNLVPIEQFIKNEVYQFELAFDCEPFGYLYSGDCAVYVSKNSEIYNEGNYESEPIFEVTGSGDCELYVNNTRIKLKNIEGKVIIDSSLLICTDSNGVNLGDKMEGDYPILKTGMNYITYTSGISEVILYPRWRCLN